MVVLDGGWNRVGKGEDADAPRRLYYMAMTHAKQNLTPTRLPGMHPMQDVLEDVSAVLQRDAPVDHATSAPELHRRYRRLSLRDVFLGFAGRRRPNDPVHQAITALSPGDRLRVRQGRDRWKLLDDNGMVVGQLARNFTAPAGAGEVHAAVMAIVSWDAERSEPEFRTGLRSDVWEVGVPELIFE